MADDSADPFFSEATALFIVQPPRKNELFPKYATLGAQFLSEKDLAAKILFNAPLVRCSVSGLVSRL